MKSIYEMIGAPQQWKQPHLMEPAFELMRNDEIIATLRFKNGFGSSATGTAANGCWTFKTQGFLKSYVTIREQGNENNLAIFRNNTWSGGGTLEFPNGRRYPANSNYWHAEFEFRNESGESLMKFTNIGGFKLHAHLDIFPLASDLKETSLLAILGWYLAVMTSREGEVVAGLV